MVKQMEQLVIDCHRLQIHYFVLFQKPGKDVQTIIQDITSQRERDEMQELEQ